MNRDSPTTMDRKMDHGFWKKVIHFFIVIPKCFYPLLGRNLLAEMNDQIHFPEKGVTIS